MPNTKALKKTDKRPFTVIIEGNIGSGKTTFLNYFKKYDNVCVLAEPVHMWRNCAGHNLLVNLISYINTKKLFNFNFVCISRDLCMKIQRDGVLRFSLMFN